MSGATPALRVGVPKRKAARVSATPAPPSPAGTPAAPISGGGSEPLGVVVTVVVNGVEQPPIPPPPPVPEADPLPRGLPWGFVLNLTLGVWLLFWITMFTDWGEGVLRLLTLGGVLSWVAVLAKVLSKPRQDQIQRFLSDVFVETGWAWYVVGVLGALSVATLFTGVVEVSNVQGGGDTAVRTYRAGSDPGFADNERLPVGGRTARCTGCGRGGWPTSA